MAVAVSFDIDVSELTPETASLIMSVGPDRPVLDWHERPVRYAKDKLDQLDDRELLGGTVAAADLDVACAIRSLLYLWTGWPDESATFAAKAPEQERQVLLGMRQRQLRLNDKAKVTVEGLDHPIFPELRAVALEAMTRSNDPILVRYREFLDLYKKWEPKLFVDLIEAGRSGRLSEDALVVARLIQVREFELLFKHCYRLATARVIRGSQPEEPEDETTQRKRIRKLREERKRASGPVVSQRPAPSDKAKPVEATKSDPFAKDDKPRQVKVGCPKCGQVSAYPESSRGKKAKCGTCAAVFTLPDKAGLNGASAKPSGVTVSCPKCSERARAAESDRGKKTQCLKCGAAFIIPKK